MQQMPLTLDIPGSFCREIGRIMVNHACIECRLRHIAYDVLGLDPKQGRLAVKEGRTHERLTLIEDLLGLRRLTVPTKMGPLKAKLQQLTVQRDQLAHGIWGRPENGDLHLRITRGEWQPIKGQRGKTKRLVKPETVPYD